MLEIVVTHIIPDPVYVAPLKELYGTLPDTNRQH
jgi:hypothetical protein